MEQSTCITCHQSKDTTRFYRSRGVVGVECRACVQVRARRLTPAGDSKRCPGCERSKPAAEFYSRPSHYTGLSWECKQCATARSGRERVTNAEIISARRKAAYRRDIHANRAERKRWNRDNPRSSRENAWRKSGIDMTWERYLVMKDAQGGKCAICFQGESGKSLAVDHDHETGAVRGLLCDDCNLALGRFKDSPDALRRALVYLKAA